MKWRIKAVQDSYFRQSYCYLVTSPQGREIKSPARYGTALSALAGGVKFAESIMARNLQP